MENDPVKIQPHQLIGKTVFYKSPHERQHKPSVVVSCKTFQTIRGNTFTLLQLENGDEVDATDVYFEPFTA